MKIYRDFLPVLQGQIGGLAGQQNFVLDTGTSPSIVNARLARELGWPTSPGRMSALGKIAASEVTRVPEIVVGPIRAEGVYVQVQDLSRLEHDLGIPVAAIVGMDVLSRESFRLNYAGSQIEFAEMPTRSGVIAHFDKKSGLAVAAVNLEGRTVRLLVDTGTNRLVVLGGNQDGFPWLNARRPLRSGGSALDSEMGVEEISVSGIVLGDRAIGGAKVYLVPRKSDAMFDGLLGVRALGVKAISYDAVQQSVYLER